MHRRSAGFIAAMLAATSLMTLPIRPALPINPPQVEPRKKRKRNKHAGTGWVRNSRSKEYPYSSDRQHKRYARNRMDEQQRNSHKPGTLQPKHIFG